MNNTKNLKVTAIFDNGGGITLQLGDKFAHHYFNRPRDAARDYLDYIHSGNTAGLEGNEPELLAFYPDDNDIRNGGLMVCDMSDIDNLCERWDAKRYADDGFCFGQANVDEFIAALIDID